MRKYRNKILLAIALAFVFVAMLGITSFALKGEEISITYGSSTGISGSFSSTSTIGGKAITLPKGDTEEGYSFYWITPDGGAYAGGSTVAFYESVSLTPIIVYDVSTAEELYEYCNAFDDSAFASLTKTQLESESITKRFIYIRLLEDIKLTKALQLETSVGSYLNIVLNGQTLTIDKSLDGALGGANFGTRLYGNGTVKYEGTGALACLDSKSAIDAKNELLIGANVYVDAPNATLGKDENDFASSARPMVDIYGTVSCKTILEISNPANRAPVVNIHSPAFLTIYGNTIVSAKNEDGTGNKFVVSIDGGTIVSKAEGISFFAETNATYRITGGSFTFPKSNANDFTLLKSYVDGKASSKLSSDYTTAFSKTCADHKFELVDTYEANCQHGTQEVYRCTTCKTLHYITKDIRTSHDFASIEPTTNQATPTKMGELIKHCAYCGCQDYTFIPYNPMEDDITIKVTTDEGEKTITAKVKDLFEIDDNYVIKGIKSFGDYEASQVIEMTIPAGIKGINISTENSTFKKLIFGSEADIEVVSLAKFTGLESIEISNASHVRFLANCAPNSLVSIKSTKVGAKVSFYDNAFNGKENLKELTFTGLCEYSFGTTSFKGTGITRLELSDNATITFTGDNAFQGSKLEYLYVGRGIKAIDKKPFASANQLQKIVFMDVTSLSDGDFSGVKDGCVVYHHASKLTLGANTFEKCKNIVVYTTADITAGFKDATFTIIKNVKHAYKADEKKATCIENGYIKYVNLDCPCGANEGTEANVYKNVYTSGKPTETYDYKNRTFPKIAHVPSDVPVIRYFDGYTKDGYYVKECVNCKEALTESATVCAPLIKSLGFSVCEDSDGGAMTVKYVLNADILKEFSNSLGADFECGTVVAVREALGDEKPLNDDGSARNGVIKINTTKQSYASLLLKVSSLNEVQKNFSFIMCTYVIENGEISYIQDNEIVKNPSGVSYKEVKELADFMEMIQTPVPASDEE